jgi:signal transduction histidine kinase/ligand-binding sensor domain-containing protein/DNA-binding response OmpR family regulator
MKLKTTLLALFCFTAFARLCGQSNEYQFSHLDFANGLSNNHITCLYKDARGFMWFGTISGLNRYDGYQFRIFKHDQKDSFSIADNYIEQILDGPNGRMWVESRAGRFSVYDLARDRFDPDYAAYLRQLSLPDAWLVNIAAGKTGYWFVYQDNGLVHYGSDGKVVVINRRTTDPDHLDRVRTANARLDPSPITDVKSDNDGYCWVIHQNGMLEKIDGLSNKVIFQTAILAKEWGGVPITPCKMYIDGQNDIWFCSNGTFKGTYFYHPATSQLKHLTEDAGLGKLSSNVVYTALQDGKGMIWLATDHGGVDILDKKDFSVKTLSHIEDDRKSLAENSITSLYRDSAGMIWLGSFKSGVNYCHQEGLQFPQFRHQPHDPGSLAFDDVNNFVEDSVGNVWIASNGGGLIYFDRKSGRFRQYLHELSSQNSLSNNIIVSLLLDKDGRLWIGTYFGGLDCFDGKKFTHYRHNDQTPGSLADDRVMCLYEDTDRNLWIGTLAAGMDRFDRRKNCFIHYNSAQPHSIRNNYVSSILEDAHRNLWVATAYGIDVLVKRTGGFIHFSSDSNRLSSDNVILLFRDSRQNMWAATREGLDLFEPDKKSFQSFTTDNGLPDNTIRSILEDRQHDLWVSTTNGLSRIEVIPAGRNIRVRCRNYHEQDGLQGRDFNERAGLATRDGYLLFGGPNGFNLFRPENITGTAKAPPIVLTGLEIFNKSVRIGEKMGGHIILDQALTETDEISLNHNEDVFSIEFAALGYLDNAANKYAYMLDGFNKSWLLTDGKIRKATYTNLDPGEYTFRVKASDADGQWYPQQASLKIIIRPPFWKTPLAYVFYILLLVGILILARWMIIRKTKMRFALEQERRETRRMHEVDLMKIRFFTNMSHELRTPLSLIIAPVEKLLANGSSSDHERISDHERHADPVKQYEMIRRNARRLLHLVNQLLDFRKMEVNELKLHPRPDDILKFIKEISFSFIDLAERKNISFTYRADSRPLLTAFDHDKIERILFNLLSNAFKFTPENGAVSVIVSAERRAGLITGADYHSGPVMLSIKVADTGIGIAPEQQEKIFQRFYQTEVPDSILNQGSGIGLAITQEFVKMHNGHLSVESGVNKGSCFTVLLPFVPLEARSPLDSTPDSSLDSTLNSSLDSSLNSSLDSSPEIWTPDRTLTLSANQPNLPPSPPSKKSTILIVEDNEDFRFYLKDNLRACYSIIEAADGKEGWRKALAEHPDLIVSDLSMPVMNGIDLCKKICADERTHHIPVILITAMTGEGAELKGLRTGAIDYIIKPFNFELLLSKIRNVLSHNATVKKTYQRQVQAVPSALQIESADESFIQNVLELIEKNMDNPDFSVEELCRQFHTSRSTFYKRLLLLTGKTPIEFIRHIRLKRAAELLEKSQFTISEIAYAVGFNNPKNFSQYFKTEFDRVPSAYRLEKKGSQV